MGTQNYGKITHKEGSTFVVGIPASVNRNPYTTQFIKGKWYKFRPKCDGTGVAFPGGYACEGCQDCKKNKAMPAKKRKTAKKGGMSKAKLSAMGKAITSKAKSIKKQHPGKKWTTCMKEAGKAYKKSHR